MTRAKGRSSFRRARAFAKGTSSAVATEQSRWNAMRKPRLAEKRGAPRDEALKNRTPRIENLHCSRPRFAFHDSRFDRGLGSLATPSPHFRAPHGHARARPTVERARTAVSGFSRERPGRSSRTRSRVPRFSRISKSAPRDARDRDVVRVRRLGVGYARTRLLCCSRGGTTTNARARTTTNADGER